VFSGKITVTLDNVLKPLFDTNGQYAGKVWTCPIYCALHDAPLYLIHAFRSRSFSAIRSSHGMPLLPSFMKLESRFVFSPARPSVSNGPTCSVGLSCCS
jgi:hypothetical protein